MIEKVFFCEFKTINKQLLKASTCRQGSAGHTNYIQAGVRWALKLHAGRSQLGIQLQAGISWVRKTIGWSQLGTQTKGRSQLGTQTM